MVSLPAVLWRYTPACREEKRRNENENSHLARILRLYVYPH